MHNVINSKVKVMVTH